MNWVKIKSSTKLLFNLDSDFDNDDVSNFFNLHMYVENNRRQSRNTQKTWYFNWRVVVSTWLKTLRNTCDNMACFASFYFSK